jgi:hypothetical protein
MQKYSSPLKERTILLVEDEAIVAMTEEYWEENKWDGKPQNI